MFTEVWNTKCEEWCMNGKWSLSYELKHIYCQQQNINYDLERVKYEVWSVNYNLWDLHNEERNMDNEWWNAKNELCFEV